MAKFIDENRLSELWAKVKELFSHAGDMRSSAYDPQGKVQDVFAYADKAERNAKEASRPSTWTPAATDVTFTDGDTFQKKYDSGELTGPAGPKGTDGNTGATGATGAAGAPGPSGKSAYQQAVEGGYKGPEAEFKAILGSGPWLPMTGGTMTGDLAFGGITNTISGLACIQSSKEEMSEGGIAIQAGVISLYGYDFGDTRVSGLATPKYPTDAANKQYVDEKVGQFVRLNVGNDVYILNVGNKTLDVGQHVSCCIMPMTSISGSSSYLVENNLRIGKYRIELAHPIGGLLGSVSANANENCTMELGYDSVSQYDNTAYLEVTRIE